MPTVGLHLTGCRQTRDDHEFSELLDIIDNLMEMYHAVQVSGDQVRIFRDLRH